MLSAKFVRIHKTSDDRWTTRDKLTQYRGILKLNVRDKKLQSLELNKLRQKVKKNLKTLRRDVTEYRQIVNHVVTGNRVRVQSTLQQHDNFHLAFGQLTIDDAVYFDALLQALEDDRKDQCKVIITATIIGQLAAENVDDLKEKYNRMTRDILKNMKERERTLAVARERVADLWEYAKSLVRVESVAALVKGGAESSRSGTDALEKQLMHLEKICGILQDTVLVRTHNELFPRLEEQMNQKARLIAHFNHNVKERDELVSKKEQALVALETLQHTMVATTGQYRIDKRAMLEEIEVQKKREADFKELRRIHGELSMKIRAALQNMLLMLVCIKRGGKAGKRDDRRTRRTEQAGGSDERETDEPVLEAIEPDGLALLAQISRKMGALFGMSSFELDEEREQRAKQLYQSYVADHISDLKYGKDELEQGLIVEHEIFDPTVLTRADVKTRSRKMVEANLKPE
ncbi:hypothetical protein KPH14_004681 [Odynerus spinipes]|uniref:Uncharacterized protein n=1 Tax=Odynerus spinipes TaxID=1348599 RepID=A0AAD9RM89_9HYME|nr:hypothetical protein KPH14_004681 [Odynerus spinipes]